MMRKEAADPAAQYSSEQQRFKGVRKRNGGKWVSEIRMPNSRDKIWLGSYASAEQAARAYDVAAYCIRGPNYVSFNFPALIPPVQPSPFMAPHQQNLDCPISRSLIRDAAASAASSFCLPYSSQPTLSAVVYNDISYNGHANAQLAPDSAELIDLDSKREQTSDRGQEWRSLFTESEDHQQERNLDRVSSLDFPTLDEYYAWTPLEDEYDSASVDLGRLWNI